MKRGWYVVLMLPLIVFPLNLGCKVEADRDDDAKIKVDNKGEHKSIEIDKD